MSEGRDHLGRFTKGNPGGHGGLTLQQRRAKAVLLKKVAEGAEPAGETLVKAARGEEVEKNSLDASKYIADQTLGKASSSSEVHVNGEVHLTSADPEG